MRRKSFIANLTMSALLLWSPVAMAATDGSSAPSSPKAQALEAMNSQRSEIIRVILNTSEGPITLALDKTRAPITTANFLRYVDDKRFDGITFYRSVKLDGAPKLGMLQAGARDGRPLLAPIAHEPTTKTGLTHSDGAVSMARFAPGTAAGDFFITLGSLPPLDADPKQPGDNQGFAVFGSVVEGMDIVRRLHQSAIAPNAGTGAMKGQMLAQPVKIISARRVKP